MNEVIKIIGLFLLVSVAAFSGMFCALWLWSYVSIVYVKKLQDKFKKLQDKFKMKQDETKKEVK